MLQVVISRVALSVHVVYCVLLCFCPFGNSSSAPGTVSIAPPPPSVLRYLKIVLFQIIGRTKCNPRMRCLQFSWVHTPRQT